MKVSARRHFFEDKSGHSAAGASAALERRRRDVASPFTPRPHAQGKTSSSSGSGSTSSPTTRAFHWPSHLGHSNATVDAGAADPRQESVSPCGKRLPNQLQPKWG